MAPTWTPEHPVDRELATRLLAEQAPGVDPTRLERVGSGWDNDVWRCGELVFRFPHRPMGAATLTNELGVLPQLAGRLPLAIPVPELVGQPSAEYPSAFYAHRYLDGRTGDQAALTEAARTLAAVPIARFLRTLHATPRENVPALRDGSVRCDVPRLAAIGLGRVPELAGTPYATHAAAAGALLAAPPPAAAPSAVCHGDLYSRHVLFDDAEQPVAVIDWGDVCWGDPAVDLSIAFSFLPPQARPGFWAEYGDVDDAAKARARCFGLAAYGVSLLVYALDVGDAPLEREAATALRYCLAEA